MYVYRSLRRLTIGYAYLQCQPESINHAIRSLALQIFPLLIVSFEAIPYIKENTHVSQEIVIWGADFCHLNFQTLIHKSEMIHIEKDLYCWLQMS